MEKKRSLTAISIVTGFVLTILLWYIQMWTDPKNAIPFPLNKDLILSLLYTNKLWPNKIEIAIAIGCVLLFVQLFIGLYPKYNRNRRWIKSVIDHIISEKFHSDLEHTRITVFKIKKGYKIFLTYFWKSLIVNFIKHYKKGVLVSHVKLMPNPFKDYLVMYTRRSNPHEKGSSTFFPVANSPLEVSGIASHSLYIAAPYKIDVQKIDDIPLKNFKRVEDINNRAYQRRVRTYMAENKIKNFDTLKCLHRMSNHIWAHPLYDKNEDAWGVIVVDNDADNELIFNEIEQDLLSYTRIITLSIIHLN